MTEVRDERKAQEYALPSRVAFCCHISPPSVDTKAQMRIAIQAMGTMTVLAMNNHRKLFGCIHRNGVLKSQNNKKLTIVLVSIPWDSGMSFLSVKNDGQIAPIMTRTAFAPFMFCTAYQKTARMARDIMATYEPQKPQDARARTGNGA